MDRVHEAGPQIPRGGRLCEHGHAVHDRDRSGQHARSREGCGALRRRQRGFVLRRDAARRSDDDADVARSLPAGIRRSGGIGTDRRPECRLEGSRVLVELFDVHALAPGRRQGYKAKSGEVPGPTDSPREIGRRYVECAVRATSADPAAFGYELRALSDRFRRQRHEYRARHGPVASPLCVLPLPFGYNKERQTAASAGTTTRVITTNKTRICLSWARSCFLVERSATGLPSEYSSGKRPYRCEFSTSWNRRNARVCFTMSREASVSSSRSNACPPDG